MPGMGKVSHPLYLREWFEGIGVEPKDHGAIADAVGCSESHLKNLIQDRRKPSTNLLFEIADFFGLRVEDFRQLPSPKDLLRARDHLPPRARRILLHAE